MRQADRERLRRILEDRLVELYRSAHRRVRSQLFEDRDVHEPLDEGDSSVRAQEDGLAHGLAEGEATRAQGIEEALRQLRSGDFGRCLDCDTEIDIERLEAVPWTLRCADCQATAEGHYHSPTL